MDQACIDVATFRLLVDRLHIRFFSAEEGLADSETEKLSMFADAVDAAPMLRRLVLHPL